MGAERLVRRFLCFFGLVCVCVRTGGEGEGGNRRLHLQPPSLPLLPSPSLFLISHFLFPFPLSQATTKKQQQKQQLTPPPQNTAP